MAPGIGQVRAVRPRRRRRAENAGLAYYAYSSLSGGQGPGPWSIVAGVNPANVEKAVTLIRKEIGRFVTRRVTAAELEENQAHFIGRLPLQLEANEGVAGALINIEQYDLGLNYYIEYPGRIAAITREAVLAAARRFPRPPGHRRRRAAGARRGGVMRSGIDMIEVERIDHAILRHGDRFFHRFFTEQELIDAAGSTPALAARFAAKEAVSKALGTGIGEVGWKEIEIVNGPRRQPELRLHGSALRLAAELGLRDWAVSLSHTHEHAIAVAVAASDLGGDG
jgi:holo-[acyl-carrier-protein] synthase